MKIVATNDTLENKSQCFSEVYEGNVCGSALQLLQGCIPDHNGTSEVYIPSNGNQYLKEERLTQLLAGLQLLIPSRACEAVIAPFLCSYYFGICDGTGELYLPASTTAMTYHTALRV